MQASQTSMIWKTIALRLVIAFFLLALSQFLISLVPLTSSASSAGVQWTTEPARANLSR